MPHIHTHDHDHSQHLTHKNLTLAFWINTGFAVLELFGGLYTNSVAILSDALHDFGDSLSLGLAYYFQKKSLRKRDESFSYGYKRFSLLGAFVNSLVLIVGSLFILQESFHRFFEPVSPNARGMLVLAIIGVVANLVAMLRLKTGSTVNERVVSLHFLEDVLGWVAVLIGSIVMMFKSLPWLDPVLSIGITAFVLFNVYKNLRQAFRIILQGTPDNVNVDEVRTKLINLPGIKGIHDVHIWSMDGQYNIMTLHLVVDATLRTADLENVKKEIRHQLEHLNIQHLTIETELEGQNCELDEKAVARNL